MEPVSSPYAVRFDVDYPDRTLNRLTTAFRIFVAIPILIVVATVSGGSIGVGRNQGGVAMAGGLLAIAAERRVEPAGSVVPSQREIVAGHPPDHDPAVGLERHGGSAATAARYSSIRRSARGGGFLPPP